MGPCSLPVLPCNHAWNCNEGAPAGRPPRPRRILFEGRVLPLLPRNPQCLTLFGCAIPIEITHERKLPREGDFAVPSPVFMSQNNTKIWADTSVLIQSPVLVCPRYPGIEDPPRRGDIQLSRFSDDVEQPAHLVRFVVVYSNADSE